MIDDTLLQEKGVSGIFLEETDMMEGNGRTLYKDIFELLNDSKCNPYIELKKWRKLGKRMITHMKLSNSMTKMFNKEIKRMSDGYGDNKNSRWSKEEDEILIDEVCKGKDDLELARMFGRTTASINTRISQLVGMRRLEQSVDGYFKGTINGIETEGKIIGDVNKGGTTHDSK